MFRRKSATQSKELLEYLARVQREQQLKSKDRIAQTAVAGEKNAELAAKRRELESLLKGALAHDPYIDLDSLKKTPRIPAFDRKKPARRSYLPEPPSAFGSLLPWRKTAYDRQYEAAEAKYKQDRHAYDEALDKHQMLVAQERVDIEKHSQEIERFKQDFAAGVPSEIENYFTLVLEKSAYPAGFPKQTEVFFSAESATLRIDFELPRLDVIPAALTFAYDNIRDEIVQTALPQKQRRLLYASALAQISLRAIHEVFSADRTNCIDSIAFDGYASGINPSTGQPGRFCLVALNITRQQFDRLDLRNVEPRACLKGLNARLSSKPDQLLPVPPNTQAGLQDASAWNASAIAQAELQISNLEGRIQTQSKQITELEGKLTARRDKNGELAAALRDKQAVIADLEIKLEAQRDRIAELVPDLRDERARNDELSAENERQRERIAKLEARSNEDADDTQPVEAISEMTAASDFVEAGLFSPVVDETADDGVGGAPVPPRPSVVDQPVSLRDLLQGTGSTRALADVEAMAASDELPYFREFVTIIDALGVDESKLLALMIAQGEACTEKHLQSAFPGRFIDPIIHDINERVYEVIDDYLIEQEGGLLLLVEEYRDALELAFKQTDNPYILDNRGSR